MISGQSLTCPKGASLTFEIDMDTGSDLTGATAQWALCESWFDGAKVYLTKTGGGDGLFIGQDGGVWKITVNLAPTDTLDIPSGLLYHDCKVLLQSGDVEDVANGPFSLDPSVNILNTNAPITRNLHAVQLLGRLGQTSPLTVAWLARNLLATQSLVGLGQSAAVTSGGVTSAVQADFTALTSLPSWLSHSRADNAMVTDSTGKLTYAPNNLLLNSNTFTAWDGTPSGVITGVADPFGGTSASTYTSVSGSSESIFQILNPQVQGKYISAIWMRRRTGTGNISLYNGDPNWVNVTSQVTSSWNLIYATSSFGNNGIRLTDAGDAVDIYLASVAAVTYETTPRSADQVITTSLPYYGPRFDHVWNGSAWVGAGLLIEAEQRTNVVLHSTDFSDGVWQFPAIAASVAHTGATNKAGSASWRITSTTGSAVHGIQQQVILAAGIMTVALDVKYVDNQWIALGVYDGGYVVASFDVLNGVTGHTDTGFISTIKSLGGGWYRITATYTTTTGANPYFAFFLNQTDGTVQTWTPSVAVSVDIDFPQLEAGPFATSYIPTTTAAVTRSADIAQLTGAALAATQVSAGSLFIEMSSPADEPTPPLLGSLSGNQAIWLYYFGGGGAPYNIKTYNGTTTLVGTDNIASITGNHRAGIVWDGSGRSIATDGGTVVTDANVGGFDAISDATFGKAGAVATIASIRLRSITIYSSRLSNANLQAKSVVGAAF